MGGDNIPVDGCGMVERSLKNERLRGIIESLLEQEFKSIADPRLKERAESSDTSTHQLAHSHPTHT